ncbi:hypothetical protein T01_10618 [Trichinella spiralis]|uniref:Uncharacterized protein n=1 Tax=Trichinella spiralis TaxID=6334 RepID=A0A0V1AYF4_TRISP|nr:hypothetical protein T01_10618 [Trichinella spiralis]
MDSDLDLSESYQEEGSFITPTGLLSQSKLGDDGAVSSGGSSFLGKILAFTRQIKSTVLIDKYEQGPPPIHHRKFRQLASTLARSLSTTSMCPKRLYTTVISSCFNEDSYFCAAISRPNLKNRLLNGSAPHLAYQTYQTHCRLYFHLFSLRNESLPRAGSFTSSTG